jgi:2-C-methyl-D-erythritol 4-phosphate cytidylyltransferase
MGDPVALDRATASVFTVESPMAKAGTSPDRASGRVVAAIVLAAGLGTRFGAPKYSATLKGERIVDRAIDLVRPFCRDVVVVLPPGHRWEGVPVSAVATGGPTRTESLRAALPLLRADVGVVVAHDCVRPLAGTEQVRAVIAAVLAGADAAIPAWESPDTLKRMREDGSIEHLGREGFVVAQSPMAYRRTTLMEVFERLDVVPVEETIGVEMIGGRVVAVAGDRWSHHLVDQRDLEMFEKLIERTSDDKARGSTG